MSTVIKGGTVVTHDLTYKTDVLVEGGIITAIGARESAPAAIRGNQTRPA